MAEQLLHDPDVRAPFQEMRRERMTQGVEGDPSLDRGEPHVSTEHPRAALAGQAATPRVQEHGASAARGGERGAAARQVRAHRVPAERTERDLSLLAPFPEDTDTPLLDVDV